ncbi:hypothetical protein HDU84_007633 [Entophlyctis sp. JEL0112]|nr:hypothetical protein HDU84_007633 [Entophlyctis sp. JEL0112]
MDSPPAVPLSMPTMDGSVVAPALLWSLKRDGSHACDDDSPSGGSNCDCAAGPAPALGSAICRAKRSRIANACQMCKASHTSCDAARPCSRCVKRGEAHLCVDAPRKASRKPSLVLAKSVTPLQLYPPASSVKGMRPLLPKPPVALRPLLPANPTAKFLGKGRSLSTSAIDGAQPSVASHLSFVQQQSCPVQPFQYSASLSSLFGGAIPSQRRLPGEPVSAWKEIEKQQEGVCRQLTSTNHFLTHENLNGSWLNSLFDANLKAAHDLSPTGNDAACGSAFKSSQMLPHLDDPFLLLPTDDIPASKASGDVSSAVKKNLIPPCHVPAPVPGDSGFVYENVDTSWLEMLMRPTLEREPGTSVPQLKFEAADKEPESSLITSTEPATSGHPRQCPVTLKTKKTIKRYPLKQDKFEPSKKSSVLPSVLPSSQPNDAFGHGVFMGDFDRILTSPATGDPKSASSHSSVKTFSSSDVSAWINNEWEMEICVDESFGRAGCSVGCIDCPFQDDLPAIGLDW